MVYSSDTPTVTRIMQDDQALQIITERVTPTNVLQLTAGQIMVMGNAKTIKFPQIRKKEGLNKNRQM